MIRKVIPAREIWVFALSLLLFLVVIFLGNKTDINAHADYISRIVTGTMKPPANFLYYLTIYCAAFFQTNSAYLYSASAVVLSLAVTAKFVITRRFMLSHAVTTVPPDGKTDRIITIMTALLIPVFSIPTGMLVGGNYYLGHITPTTWHNSTTIFLMPFALLLFWLSYEQLVQPTRRRIFLITGLGFLNILVKPSYYFVFCIAYPLMLMKSFGFRKRLWENLMPVLAVSGLLFVEYILIYLYDFGNAYPEKGKIAISPFSMWSQWTTNIPLTLIGSLLFPLVYLFFYGKELLNNLLLQYAVLAYVIALIIFSVFTETGPRQFSGNFYWQCIVSSYILFMVMAVLMAGKVLQTGNGTKKGLKDLIRETPGKNKVLLFFFLLHVISGIVFVGYLIYLGKSVST